MTETNDLRTFRERAEDRLAHDAWDAAVTFARGAESFGKGLEQLALSAKEELASILHDTADRLQSATAPRMREMGRRASEGARQLGRDLDRVGSRVERAPAPPPDETHAA